MVLGLGVLAGGADRSAEAVLGLVDVGDGSVGSISTVRKLATSPVSGAPQVPVTIVDLDSAANVLRAELDENTANRARNTVVRSTLTMEANSGLTTVTAKSKPHSVHDHASTLGGAELRLDYRE